MGEEHRIERVLLAVRGGLAHRLIAHFRAEGIETVAAFSEADAEAAWLEEADFDAYLNGRTVAESYGHPEHVVSAAMDAGCDAIHPGTGPLAESIELFHLANNANVAVISGDPTVVARAADRTFQRNVALRGGLRVLPASGVLPDPSDGLEAAAPLGVPLEICAASGARMAVVHDLAQLPERVSEARERALALCGSRDLILRRAEPPHAVRRSTLVAAERTGRVVELGTLTTHLRGPGGEPWLDELGADLDGSDLALGEAAVEVVKGLRWVSLCAVRWSIVDDAPYFSEVSVRLPGAFDLFESVHGIELLRLQVELLQGKALGWGDHTSRPNRWGLQVRLMHRPGPQGREAAILERFVLPDGAEAGVSEGESVGPDTVSLLAKVTVVADSRPAAWQALREALAAVVVEGVPTNLGELREAVDKGPPSHGPGVAR